MKAGSDGKEPASESSDAEEVEKVEDMIIRKGKEQYVLNWLKKSARHDDCDNTPKPEEQLDCPDLVDESQNRLHQTKIETQKRQVEAVPECSDQQVEKKQKDDKINGFDRGFHPDKIIGVTYATGELMFLIKWIEVDEAELVPAKIANVRCPQTVIQFYEGRISWQ